MSDSDLIAAIRANDPKKVKSLLESGVHVNTKDGDGPSGLTFAAESGFTDVCRILVKFGVKEKNNRGLIKAIDNKFTEISRLLIESGPELKYLSLAALFLMIEGDHTEACKLLIKTSRIDLNVRNDFGEIALLIAARKGNVDVCKCLIMAGADVNVKGNSGTTALINAIECGHIEVCRVLVAEKKLKPISCKNALIQAAECGQTEICRLLIESGTVDLEGKPGETALIKALWRHNADTCEFLIRGGVNNLDVLEIGSCPVLVWTAAYLSQICRVLIDCGANVNVQDSNGNTALISSTSTVLSKLLIKHGANVNIKNIKGDTALTLSARYGRTELIPLLIESGADVNMKGYNGCTALIHAVERGNAKLCQLLIESGTDISVRNSDGKTALDLARNEETKEVMRKAVEFFRSTLFMQCITYVRHHSEETEEEVIEACIPIHICEAYFRHTKWKPAKLLQKAVLEK